MLAVFNKICQYMICIQKYVVSICLPLKVFLENRFFQDLENWQILITVREIWNSLGFFFLIMRKSGKNLGILIFDLVVESSPELPSAP